MLVGFIKNLAMELTLEDRELIAPVTALQFDKSGRLFAGMCFIFVVDISLLHFMTVKGQMYAISCNKLRCARLSRIFTGKWRGSLSGIFGSNNIF